jgi:hypothetical protein
MTPRIGAQISDAMAISSCSDGSLPRYCGDCVVVSLVLFDLVTPFGR